MKRIVILLSIAAILSGCGSIRVWNLSAYDILELGVVRAARSESGEYSCPERIANILPEPISPGGSYVVRGLWCGRYCISRQVGRFSTSVVQIETPLIGQVDVYVR